jgi:hypothetical protein
MKTSYEMMEMLFRFTLGLVFLASGLNAQQIVNGQVYTPGIAIVDAPQPNTPLGGGEFSCQIILSPVYVFTGDRLPASCARRVL